MGLRSFVISLMLTCGYSFAPQPKMSIVTQAKSSVGGWEKDYYSTVNVEPSQLDAAFMTANGAALEEKISAVSKSVGMSLDDTKTKLMEAVGEQGILGTDPAALAKKIQPKEKKSSE